MKANTAIRMAEKTGPDLMVVGLDSANKQRRFALSLEMRESGFDLDQILHRLRKIRKNVLLNIASLTHRFMQRASEQKGVEVFLAGDEVEAVAYIKRVCDREKPLAINRANVIRELRPRLEQDGFRLVNTYLARYACEEDKKVLNHYWQLPFVTEALAFESFGVEKLYLSNDRKDYTALLGVTAASAEDGAVCFLQHNMNIGTMLNEARRLVLIVGTEKIVDTRDDAFFQTRCMGFFGMESVILDMKCPGESQECAELGMLKLEDFQPDIHIILLDNDRSRIAKDAPFADLLKCISCRACAKHCPTHHYFNLDTGNYPRQYIWSYLMGSHHSLDLCIGCGMCLHQCPLEIDIPRLVSLSRSAKLKGWTRKMGSRALNNPRLLMGAARLSAPMANSFLKNRLARTMLEKTIGLQREAWLPEARFQTFDQWFRSRKSKEDKV